MSNCIQNLVSQNWLYHSQSESDFMKTCHFRILHKKPEILDGIWLVISLTHSVDQKNCSLDDCSMDV